MSVSILRRDRLVSKLVYNGIDTISIDTRNKLTIKPLTLEANLTASTETNESLTNKPSYSVQDQTNVYACEVYNFNSL